MKIYRICASCVMDTSDPGIQFDERGVCDHCNNFLRSTLPRWHPDETGQAMLQKKVDQIKQHGKGKEFDCIIGVSGGADSSYLVYLAKEKLGLRPLVFHVDGGWNSQIAVNNIEKLIDGLGLELYTEVINWNEMRDLQLAFFKSGVPHIDLPQDHAFFATMYNFANKYGVKYILTGSNISTECVRNPLEFFYYGTDMWQIKDIHRQFGQRPLVEFPLSGILRHKVYLRYFKGIEVVQPLDSMPYVKADAMRFLAERFGWQIYARKHFESRFTKFFEGYWLPKKFGFDTRRVQYSSMILTKQMKREDALADLEKPPYDPATIAQDFEYIATKLEIPVAELQGYMDAPNKSFRDYRNQEHLFRLGATVLHGLGIERRAKKR
jgi:N-acetyl sugar amidotransferase